MPYSIVNHTADFGIKVYGSRDLPSLFYDACMAMIFEIGADTECIDEKIEFESDGFDIEDLLVSFLNDVLFSVQTRGFRISGIEIEEMTDNSLKFRMNGSYTDTPLKMYIKAATQHDLAIMLNDEKYETTIIFDV